MISFIIPWRSIGDPYREKSFDYNKNYLRTNWPDNEIIVADTQGTFNRSAARNAGADQANGDVLVFMDADSFVPEEQLDRVEHRADLAGWILPYSTYWNLTEEASEKWMSQDFHGSDSKYFPEIGQYEYVFPGPDPVDRPAAVGGCVVVSRVAFELVGGYDERFEGWGEEDRAFIFSLETLVGPSQRLVGPLFHLWHPASEEDRFGQPHFEENRALCNRYREANRRNDQAMMRQLVQEHKGY